MAELLKPLNEEMMMNMKRKLLGAVALFAMFGALEANAQQTRDLVVTAEVPEVCVINSPAQIPMAFGILDVVNGAPGNYQLDADFVWRCSAGTTVNVELGLGLGLGANLTQRVMTGINDNTNTLPYRLSTTANADWGSLPADAVPATATGINTPDTSTIRGVITVADIQAANVDQYQDTVLITLTL